MSILRTVLRFPAKPIYSQALRNGHNISVNHQFTTWLNRLFKNHFQTSATCNAANKQVGAELSVDVGRLYQSDLYHDLLLHYDKAEQPNKAVALWNQMQKENVKPSVPFLVLLASILRRHNMEVPFAVPDAIAASFENNGHTERTNKYSNGFRILLRVSVDKAIQFRQRNPDDGLSDVDLALLMESLLNNDRIEEAKLVFRDLLYRDVFPHKELLKLYVNILTSKGDIYELEYIESRKLSNYQKAFTALESRKCVAHLHAGRIEEYLTKLEEKLDSVQSDTEYTDVMRSFPRGGILRVLSNKPETLMQIKRIAEKSLEKNSNNTDVINVLWMYHMIQKNFNEADKLWRQYFKHKEGPIRFQPILVQAKKNADVEILTKLRQSLESKAGITKFSLGLVYGITAEVLVAEDNVKDASILIDEAVKAVSLENMLFSSLEIVKAACIVENIPFKHDTKRGRVEDYTRVNLE